MKLETLPSAPVQPAASKKRWRVPVIALLVAGVAAGCYAATRPAAKPAETKEAKQAPVLELAGAEVATIEARELSMSLPLSGSLVPLNQAMVKSKTSGVVRETLVQEGVGVAAGQVIARLDSADQRARLAQSQAAVDEASARLSMARKNNANSESLRKQNYISQNAYDTSQNGVELAQASLNAAQAQRAIARIAVADTVIHAPLSGVVSKRHLQAGEKASPDMPVFTIVNLRQLTLEAQVPASEIPRVKVGQEVQFHVDGYQQRNFAGRVARINPTTDGGSRAMLVYISVDNSDAALRGGMFAKGTITTDKSRTMPLVPLGALRKDKGRDVVYTIEGDKVVSQPVTLGMRNDDAGLAEVTAGLAKGARVIVAKLDGVKPGDTVKLAPAAPVAAAVLAAKG
ncbi:efflux RND transporter periplasmic adaptor subunit [Massilia glaciei]|uniref:Efflux RND transporter periplasmic adaptor subunit n=1 Tax=Massilia glaciei TaxID=1524097 RepID=A0A2U2I7L8_9BURK|nr:efflux RND transporter periplasmic adaptor subunit [Massilia glaciei]PWF55705.1 efflux RND transporter periplasmic adaptor subunit [Massilia glaciei]